MFLRWRRAKKSADQAKGGSDEKKSESEPSEEELRAKAETARVRKARQFRWLFSNYY